MSRQTRLIIVLAVMALVGVVSLGMIAERYSKLNEGRETSSQTGEQQAAIADRQVDAFVRVRKLLAQVVESETFKDIEGDSRDILFASQRDRALSLARVSAADYRELRQHFRKWRHDPNLLPVVWRSAFDQRAADLADCDLGELEVLDR